MCRTHLNPTLHKVWGEGTLFLWLKGGSIHSFPGAACVAPVGMH